MPGGRPTKLTPELEAEILELIGDGGLTYTDACRCVGINDSIQELEGVEARFRLVHLGKIRDGALNVGVEKRTVVRRKAIINEAGETVPALKSLAGVPKGTSQGIPGPGIEAGVEYCFSLQLPSHTTGPGRVIRDRSGRERRRPVLPTGLVPSGAVRFRLHVRNIERGHLGYPQQPIAYCPFRPIRRVHES